MSKERERSAQELTNRLTLLAIFLISCACGFSETALPAFAIFLISCACGFSETALPAFAQELGSSWGARAADGRKNVAENILGKAHMKITVLAHVHHLAIARRVKIPVWIRDLFYKTSPIGSFNGPNPKGTLRSQFVKTRTYNPNPKPYHGGYGRQKLYQS